MTESNKICLRKDLTEIMPHLHRIFESMHTSASHEVNERRSRTHQAEAGIESAGTPITTPCGTSPPGTMARQASYLCTHHNETSSRPSTTCENLIRLQMPSQEQKPREDVHLPGRLVFFRGNNASWSLCQPEFVNWVQCVSIELILRHNSSLLYKWFALYV